MRLSHFCPMIILLVAGCSSGINKFPLAQATGTVTCDGKPVSKALVYFEPKKVDKEIVIGKQGFALTDGNGRFTVSTYGENDGAVIGRHIVRVGSTEGTPGCDCSLVADVPLIEVDVKSDQTNDFDLKLKKPSVEDRVEVDRTKLEEQLEKELDKDEGQ